MNGATTARLLYEMNRVSPPSPEFWCSLLVIIHFQFDLTSLPQKTHSPIRPIHPVFYNYSSYTLDYTLQCEPFLFMVSRLSTCPNFTHPSRSTQGLPLLRSTPITSEPRATLQSCNMHADGMAMSSLLQKVCMSWEMLPVLFQKTSDLGQKQEPTLFKMPRYSSNSILLFPRWHSCEVFTSWLLPST